MLVGSKLGTLARPTSTHARSRQIAWTPRTRTVARISLRPGETPEQAQERRARESQRVEERVTDITSVQDWQQQTHSAGDKLIVLEVTSEVVCQTGLQEEAEMQWKVDKQQAMAPCVNVKHAFQRIARECPDVTFMAVNADDPEAGPLLDQLSIDVIPTVQFWRSRKLLWEHRGVNQMEQDIGEGVLYFGDTAAGGVHASEHVRELHSAADLSDFISSQDERVLTVVNVSVSSADPCIHIYPAVLALARSFKGYAAFGRLMGDESPETQQLLAQYNVLEVPTFLFFKNGKEVMRHVGSSRGDLIGKILQVQSEFGVAPPPPRSLQALCPAAAALCGAETGIARTIRVWLCSSNGVDLVGWCPAFCGATHQIVQSSAYREPAMQMQHVQVRRSTCLSLCKSAWFFMLTSILVPSFAAASAAVVAPDDVVIVARQHPCPFLLCRRQQ